MEALTVRLLPLAAADGPHNMAADEVLLRSATAGIASLRFYTWSAPTLSLGYFQPAADRLKDPRLTALPYVRRPSGGHALVHHHELTYALALPERSPDAARAWLGRMHGAVHSALRSLGAGKWVTSSAGEGIRERFLCFERFAESDLICAGFKLAGSAQRRQRHALLQHGAVLLARSEYAPSLPGLLEATGLRRTPEEVARAVADVFPRDTGFELREGDWTGAERATAEELAAARYSQPAWNAKR